MCSVSGRRVWRRYATSSRAAGVVPDLGGRTALVTGSAHGIGAAILHALEQHGATAHGVDKDTVNVADTAQVGELVARLGRIDILVNNAGGVCGQVGKPL